MSEFAGKLLIWLFVVAIGIAEVLR